MNKVSIYVGDCIDVLKLLPSKSVQCCVTSPPYWGLRDYGVDGQVWGGDADCEHEWGKSERQHPGYRSDYGAPKQQSNRGTVIETETITDAFCQLCGAWHGSLGLEPTPELYVEHLVEIFREVKRVLRDDGVCWLNLGDSYAGSWGNYAPGGIKGQQRAQTENGKRWDRAAYDDTTFKPPTANANIGLKPKDLCGIPWRVAFALQADGWWLRSDIIWQKKNAMPESVMDRPTKAHEYVFLLTKAKRYFYDAEAIKEQSTGQNGKAADFKRETKDHLIPNQAAVQHRNDREPTTDNGTRNKRTVWDIAEDHHPLFAYLLANLASDNPEYLSELLNHYSDDITLKKDIWTIPTQPYSGAHFATFPPALIEPMIKAGTSERGCCPECGAGWVRVVKRESAPPEVMTKRNAPTDELVHSGTRTGGEMYGVGQKLQNWRNEHPSITVGWRPACDCGESISDNAARRLEYPLDSYGPQASMDPVPCTVLDPFAGAGTVGLVAARLQRNSILIELNPEYAKMAQERIIADGSMFTSIELLETLE